MNYDLAIMALEGLTRAPLRVSTQGGEVVFEGSASALKELARLLLLIASGTSADNPSANEDGIELQPSVHVTTASPRVRFRRSGD